MVLDTDSIYHGVERVGRPDEPAPVSIVAGAQLHHDGGRWVLNSPAGDEIGHYPTEAVRISISWKAYTFADRAARDRFELDRGSLTVDEIERRLFADLRDRGLLADDERPFLPDLADLLIDTYQRFPHSATA